jgi:hypothetical protein
MAAEGYNPEEYHPAFLNCHNEMRTALETGEIEGVRFKVLGPGKTIEPGDTYIAERNTGLKLLTCRENVRDQGFIVATEWAYAYDTGECIKIELDIS